MEVRTRAQTIEVFHLLFLRVLGAGQRDWFVLKGGANIRYFFDSPRYSNDIDLDFSGREAWKVGDTVGKILEGRALQILAQQAGVEIAEVSAPKQTDTTRRWKIGLRATGHTDSIRTKIEFSDRNGSSDDVVAEVVPNGVVVPYGLQSPMVQHYGATAAIEQKIAALALRSETKARDVFDLDLLSRRQRARGVQESLSTEHAGQAASRALEITFDRYVTEVAPFLDPDIAVLYDEDQWDRMREAVATWLANVAESNAVERGRA